MCYFRDGPDVGNGERGVPGRFDMDEFGMRAYRGPYRVQVGCVHQSGFHMEFTVKQFIQQPIYGDICHARKDHMIAALKQSKNKPERAATPLASTIQSSPPSRDASFSCKYF